MNFYCISFFIRKSCKKGFVLRQQSTTIFNMRRTAVLSSKFFPALPARRIPSHLQLLIKIYEISLFFLLQLALAMLQLSKTGKFMIMLPCLTDDVSKWCTPTTAFIFYYYHRHSSPEAVNSRTCPNASNGIDFYFLYDIE